jgi:predicted 3-demethylubiquinone-9 3-methyltransferase (glyoxalase superfamily)
MQIMQKITPCLWFDDQAEEVVDFYVSIFNNSKIVTIARLVFELDGQSFTALNGGMHSNLAKRFHSRFSVRHKQR